MEALRIFVGLWKKVSSSIFPECKNPRICNYSTLDSGPSRRWSYFSEVKEKESSVFKHALMFQRPSTIDYNVKLCNSVSLIGTVMCPLKKVNSTGGVLGVYTFLKFKNSSHSSLYSQIMLKMWDKMAEVSIIHLKPGDFIYIWGDLCFYEKTGEDEKRKIFHGVNVKEINYIGQDAQGPQQQQQTKTMDFQDKDYPERKRKRLLLWQTFFANPYEWTDCRTTKQNPKAPDFKHKSTGESLWIKPDDPPWISKQLILIERLISGQPRESYNGADLCSFFPED